VLDGSCLDVIATGGRCSGRRGLRPFDVTPIPPTTWGCSEALAMDGIMEPNHSRC